MSILKLIEMKTLFKYLGAVAIIAMVGVNCYVASGEIVGGGETLFGLSVASANGLEKDYREDWEVNVLFEYYGNTGQIVFEGEYTYEVWDCLSGGDLC